MEVTIEKLRKINHVVADVSDEEEYCSDEENKPAVQNKNKRHVEDSSDEEEEDERVTVEMPDKHRRLARLQGYTVHVDGHRILAVYTYCNTVAATWIREVLRCYRKNKKEKEKKMILVGVSVSRQHNKKDTKYDLVQLCVGSQCLIFELPDDIIDRVPLPFNTLLDNPRVVCAGANMTSVAAKLLRDHGIRVANVMDLNKEAAEVVLKGQDLLKWDLDRLATAVMGRRWLVDRPVKDNQWFVLFRFWFDRQLAMDKAMYATYDAYVSFVIGGKLMEMKTIGVKVNKKEKKRAY